MKFPPPVTLLRALPWAVALAMAAVPAAAQGSQVGDEEYLLYLPSRAVGVDHGAIIRGFEDLGFSVMTYAYEGEKKSDYARRVASEVRALIARGVSPEAITVVGAGTGSAVAVLASAATSNRRVNYVLLGQCDSMLKVNYRFRMSGRVLGLRDATDSSSQSCRPLWSGSPNVGERRDVVVNTGHGAALFDQPRPEWVQPVASWARGGHVDVGTMRIGATEPPQTLDVAAISAAE